MTNNWQYAITTVPERFHTTLPRTLASLARGGFGDPLVFVDGCLERDLPDVLQGLRCVVRPQRIRAYGNWVLAAWQLYLEDPVARRYAIFQDDLITYKNLRAYLDRCTLPERGYWNLYTFPQNEGKYGWHYSPLQDGKGALALVFSNNALRRLLSSRHMVDRVDNHRRGHRGIDGGVITALRELDDDIYKEYVHTPSLVQHIGEVSSIGTRRHPFAVSFLGEDYDALELLSCVSS